MTRTDLCVECAGDIPGLANALPLDQLLGQLTGLASHRETLLAALGGHLRYPIEAYEFVCEALDYCRNSLAEKPGDETIHHVSGKELLEVIRQLIVQKFSKQAKAVLASWNILRTEDFGEIVFEMIDAGLLAKKPADSKEDFRNVFSFEEVFPEAWVD
jgi:uncharacterized repeat protein (TIGR04138 family)